MIQLIINDEKVVCVQNSLNMWTIDIDKIKFIGEYTTSAGPFADDWFFVFADSIDHWWQIPAIEVEHEKFWKQLGQKLNCELAPRLFTSTSWATSVIYPKSLDGQELFIVVKNEAKLKTFWQKLFKSNDNDEHIELTDNVKQLF